TFDASTGAILHETRAHDGKVVELRYAQGSIVSVAADRTARVWSTDLKGGRALPSTVAVSERGALAQRSDGALEYIPLPTGAPVPYAKSASTEDKIILSRAGWAISVSWALPERWWPDGRQQRFRSLFNWATRKTAAVALSFDERFAATADEGTVA